MFRQALKRRGAGGSLKICGINQQNKKAMHLRCTPFLMIFPFIGFVQIDPFLRPFFHSFKDRFERLPFFSQGVFDPHRSFWIHMPVDDALVFEFF
jgi:hypothetical protein